MGAQEEEEKMEGGLQHSAFGAGGNANRRARSSSHLDDFDRSRDDEVQRPGGFVAPQDHAVFDRFVSLDQQRDFIAVIGGSRPDHRDAPVLYQFVDQRAHQDRQATTWSWRTSDFHTLE